MHINLNDNTKDISPFYRNGGIKQYSVEWGALHFFEYMQVFEIWLFKDMLEESSNPELITQLLKNPVNMCYLGIYNTFDVVVIWQKLL